MIEDQMLEKKFIQLYHSFSKHWFQKINNLIMQFDQSCTKRDILEKIPNFTEKNNTFKQKISRKFSTNGAVVTIAFVFEIPSISLKVVIFGWRIKQYWEVQASNRLPLRKAWRSFFQYLNLTRETGTDWGCVLINSAVSFFSRSKL